MSNRGRFKVGDKVVRVKGDSATYKSGYRGRITGFDVHDHPEIDGNLSTNANDWVLESTIVNDSKNDVWVPLKAWSECRPGDKLRKKNAGVSDVVGDGEIVTVVRDGGDMVWFTHDSTVGSDKEWNSIIPENWDRLVTQSPIVTPKVNSEVDVGDWRLWQKPLCDNTCKCGAPKPCSYHD